MVEWSTNKVRRWDTSTSAASYLDTRVVLSLLCTMEKHETTTIAAWNCVLICPFACTTWVSKLRTSKLQRSIWKPVCWKSLLDLLSRKQSHIPQKKVKGKITFKGNQQMTYGDQHPTPWKFNSPTSSSNRSVWEFPFMSYDGDGLKLLIGIYTFVSRIFSNINSCNISSTINTAFFLQHGIHSWETFSNLFAPCNFPTEFDNPSKG